MGNTIRRQPISSKIPANPDYYFQNIMNFGGINITSNPFTANPETASDCKNVYVDEEFALTTRPRVQEKFDLRNTFVDEIDWIGVYNLHEGYLLHGKREYKYYSKQYHRLNTDNITTGTYYKRRYNLPEYLIPLEYIESDGRQVVDLGSDTDYNSTSLYMDYQFTTIDYDVLQAHIPYYIQSSWSYFDYMRCVTLREPQVGYIDYYDYTSDAYGKFQINGENVNIDTDRHILSRDSQHVLYDNQEVETLPRRTPTGAITGTRLLFAGFGGDSNRAHMRLYEFKIGSDDEIKLHLIPCKQKGIYGLSGLYDIIHKDFIRVTKAISYQVMN